MAVISTDSAVQTANVDNNYNPISASTAVAPTQQRIEAMQQIDVAQLESVETPDIHKFYNFFEFLLFTNGAIIFVVFVLSFVLVDNTVLSFVLTSTTVLLFSAYLYSTRTKIVHFKNQQTYLWYQGNSVIFIYVKEMTDRILTWTTTSSKFSLNSGGWHTKTTHHRHFRIIDVNGGELFSGEDAGGRARWGRDQLIALLGLETMDKHEYNPPPRKHSVTGNTMRK